MGAATCGNEQRQRAQAPCNESAAAVGAAPSGNAQRQQGSCKVQKPRRTHRTKKLGLYHVSRRVDARPASLPERERLLVLLRPGPLPTPDAGKALIHTQVLAPASRITAMCRVRNNRIICQSSDPLEGMAITLNQWILLTARAARPDAVAPNARRGTRLPSPQVPDARIAR